MTLMIHILVMFLRLLPLFVGMGIRKWHDFNMDLIVLKLGKIDLELVLKVLNNTIGMSLNLSVTN